MSLYGGTQTSGLDPHFSRVMLLAFQHLRCPILPIGSSFCVTMRELVDQPCHSPKFIKEVATCQLENSCRGEKFYSASRSEILFNSLATFCKNWQAVFLLPFQGRPSSLSPRFPFRWEQGMPAPVSAKTTFLLRGYPRNCKRWLGLVDRNQDSIRFAPQYRSTLALWCLCNVAHRR